MNLFRAVRAIGAARVSGPDPSSAPKRPVRAIDGLLGFLVFSTVFYSYHFFFPFRQGFSEAPFLVKALKDFLWLLLLPFCLGRFRLDALVRDRASAFVTCLFAAVTVTSLLRSALSDSAGLETLAVGPLKSIVFFGLAYYVVRTADTQDRERLCRFFLVMLPIIAAFQAVLSFVFLFLWPAGVIWSETHFLFLWPVGIIWSETHMSGLMGNPNSYALLLNLGWIGAVASAEPVRYRNRFAILFPIACGILASKSNSQLLIFAFLNLLAGLLWVRREPRRLAAIWTAGALGLAAVCLVSRVQPVTDFRVLAQLSGIIGLGSPAGTATGDLSQSISGRLEDHLLAFDMVKSPSWGHLLVGDLSRPLFMVDSQFLNILFNSGLLVAVGFVIWQIWTMCALPWRLLASRGGDVGLHARACWLALSLVAFVATFLFSRVMEYFPFNVYYFMLIGLSRDLMARAGKPAGDPSGPGEVQRSMVG